MRTPPIVRTGSAPRATATWPTAPRSAASRVFPPNSRTSPRSSTASCSSSGSSWSASGRAAPRPTPRRRWPSWPGSPRRPGRSCSTPLVQRRSHPDGATYIGSGKVIELIEIVEATGADTVICDGELTPSQLRNLEERLKVKVVDRTALILDIFAQHARSREGKAQVELAQLNYLVPRLRGWGAALSRQRGGRVAAGAGIGSRGPGETKLEIDRRRIHKRISQLKSELTGMRRVRDTKRSQRRANAVPAVSIAGYTNAGQVVAAEPADRRRGAGRGRAVRHPRSRPPAGPAPPTAGCTPSPTRSASSGICRTNWWSRSGRPWRRSPTPICCCTSSTAPTSIPEEQVAAVREVLGEIDALAVRGDHRGEQDRHRGRDDVDQVAARVAGRGVRLCTDRCRASSELRLVIAGALPDPAVSVRVLMPFTEGALVSRVHSEGTVLTRSTPPTGPACTPGCTRTWPVCWRRSPPSAELTHPFGPVHRFPP